MGTAILRAVKRSGVGGRLAKHIRGETRPKSAEKREGLEPVADRKHHLGGVDKAAKKLMEARKTAPKKRGPAPMGGVELLFAGPPRYSDPDAWPVEKVDKWVDATLKWRDKTFPGMVSSVTAVHQDEGSPHVHDLCAAVDTRGRVGFNYVLEDVYGEPGDLKAGDRELLTRLQDDYWQSVGRHFGLDRGERGRRKQKHVPVNQDQAAKIRELEDKVSSLEGELTAARAPTGPVRGGVVPATAAARVTRETTDTGRRAADHAERSSSPG